MTATRTTDGQSADGRGGGGIPARIVLETERLRLREVTPDDASFILQLLNEPGWLRYIGDRGVHTLDDARRYLDEGPRRMYAQHGFGLWLVERREDALPLGLCGLIRRETLPDVDIGFALTESQQRHGYAFEAAAATLDYARDVLRLRRVVAIALPDNVASTRLLERLGMRLERTIRLAPDAELLNLYGTSPAMRVLFVCTGNICRSPTAEAVFRAYLQHHAPDLAVEIDSAGTHDYHVGEPPDSRAQRAAARRGLDLSGLRARQVEARDFTHYDLILAMDRDNRERLLTLSPPELRPRVRLLLEYAPGAGRDDVPDPYYGGSAGFDEVLDLVERAAPGVLDALRRLS